MTKFRPLWIGLATCILAACTGGGGDDSPPPKDPDAQSSDVDALNSILTQPSGGSSSNGNGGSSTTNNSTSSSGLPIITARQIADCANLPEMSPVDMSRASCLVGAFDGRVYDRTAKKSTDQPCHSEFTASGQLTITTGTTRVSQMLNPIGLSTAGGSRVIHSTTFLGVENVPFHSIFSVTDGSGNQGFEQASAKFTDSESGQVAWVMWSSITTDFAKKERVDCASVITN